jgi:hypothetical protein
MKVERYYYNVTIHPTGDSLRLRCHLALPYGVVSPLVRYSFHAQHGHMLSTLRQLCIINK